MEFSISFKYDYIHKKIHWQITSIPLMENYRHSAVGDNWRFGCIYSLWIQDAQLYVRRSRHLCQLSYNGSILRHLATQFTWTNHRLQWLSRTSRQCFPRILFSCQGWNASLGRFHPAWWTSGISGYRREPTSNHGELHSLPYTAQYRICENGNTILWYD